MFRLILCIVGTAAALPEYSADADMGFFQHRHTIRSPIFTDAQLHSVSSGKGEEEEVGEEEEAGDGHTGGCLIPRNRLHSLDNSLVHSLLVPGVHCNSYSFSAICKYVGALRVFGNSIKG